PSTSSNSNGPMRLPAGNGSSSPVSPIVCAALAASPGSSQSPCSASAASNRSSSARTPGSPQRSASMRARASGASESACSNKSRSVGVDSTAAVLRSHPKTFQKPFALSAASKARSQRAWENTERAVFRFRGAALRYAQHERFFIPEATPPINPACAPFAPRGASFQMGLDEGAREAPVAVDGAARQSQGGGHLLQAEAREIAKFDHPGRARIVLFQRIQRRIQ